MAADADTTDDELSRTVTKEQPLTETETATSPDANSSPAADQTEPADDPEAGADPRPDSNDIDGVGVASAAEAAKRRTSPVRLATLVGLVAAVALGGVIGWLGFRTYQLSQNQEQRELFLSVGRQGAVNLTTIDWQTVDRDIHRILDSATGTFYDDFSKRSPPFIEVVKKAQSKSVGTVTEAGLESTSRTEARVLVAIAVKTSNLGAEEEPPRSWRMRIDVQKVDDGAKISNVLFVPA
jgi:Mce-associated membrane protein